MPVRGLLIASPQLRDANFHRTVVLVCHHDAQGALGLVLTREGTVRVDEVLERLDIPSTHPHPALTGWGGPVGDGVGFVIWRGEVGAHEGWTLDDNVAVSPSAERLARLVEDGGAFDLVLGYAGWGPGQLESELDEGSWLFADVDHRVVLDVPRGGRYEAALALLGLSPDVLFMRPVDA